MANALTSASKVEQRRLWLAAAKPPMYSVAIMPSWIGSSFAFSQQGQWDGIIFTVFTFSLLSLLAWTNISNDVFDAETGIDINKPHSIVTLTGKPRLMFWIANIFFLIGILGIGWIGFCQKSWAVVVLVLVSCGLSYAYQGPMFRWGYRGWGECLVFMCFGPLGVSAAYYSQTHSWSVRCLLTAVLVGLTTSLILFCSHFHQVEDDQAAGKNSPVVQLGTRRSAQIVPIICGSVYGIHLLLIALDILPIWTLVAIVLSVYFAVSLCHLLLNHHQEPDEISRSKFIAVNFNFCYAFTLGLALILNPI